MKKRNRKKQQRFATKARKPLSLLSNGTERKRKSWTFERLEDRLVFSVSPYDAPQFAAPQLNTMQAVSYSNQTPEGAALTLLDELRWAQMAVATSSAQTGDLSSSASTANYQTMSLPNDPYFPSPNNPSQLFTQWNLLNIGQNVGQPGVQNLFGVPGQDLDVVPAWNMTDSAGRPIIGTGVKVAVIDTGVQLFHPDLAANISTTLRFNSVNGTNTVSPDLADLEAFHGTAVAGIIGAVANNGVGGVGVAPGVTLIPIKASTFGGFSDQSIEDALLYALQHNVDITNNSYGPIGRVASPLDPTLLQIFRDAAINGRNGLGMINVFSAGNDGGPGLSQGFGSYGNLNSSSYNPLVNSRFNIGVTAVSHTGLYNTGDGTFFDWPVSGPSVLVAAPSGSTPEAGLTVGSDTGFGSGITTTDLVGDFGLNAAPLPSGFDPDSDHLPNPDYTSRMGGTSAAAPEVAGVIALMLQANPNLTYRDVQEILVRSSRQNAEFESPASGGIGGSQAANTSWQVNQSNPFRNPDPYDGTNGKSSIPFNFPVADPNNNIFGQFGFGGGFAFGFYAPDTNDFGRQEASSYEPQPPVYTNGAGYTVSQGYGIYGEQIGYAHGVVDAAAAVYMAKHWSELNQNIAPNTELTYTTSFVSSGTNGGGGFVIPPVEYVADPPAGNAMVIPGGIQFNAVSTGWNAYWNQYYTDTPFANYTGKSDIDRGLSYLDFAVPPSNEMDIEWVEVKVDITGDPHGLNGLRLMLASPDGTQSELNNYYVQPSAHSTQPGTNASGWQIDPGSSFDQTNGHFVWTFSTNRDWGENSSSQVIIHPATGEPVMAGTGAFALPVFRNWEFHVENYSTSQFNIEGMEVIWHGKPVGGGKLDPNYAPNGIISGQRVQGLVGIDSNGDNAFNFNRYIQSVSSGFNGPHADTSDIRSDEITRTLDFTDVNLNGVYDEGDVINQEPFAANIVVDAYKVWGGVAEVTPTARFLTGADGNYYFDLDPVGDLAQTKDPTSPHFGQTIEYQIRASDPLSRNFLQDVVTPSLTTTNSSFTYLPHYQQVWTINPNWFFASDHDNPTPITDNPGEIFYDPSGNTTNVQGLLDETDIPEPGLGMPVAWNNNATLEHIVPAPVKNLNFLLKAAAPAMTVDVTGTVYSDVNGDGKVNGADAGAAGVNVYWDKNKNGVRDAGEAGTTTDALGKYTLTIDLNTITPVPTDPSLYQIGVVKPNNNWNFVKPNNGIDTVFAGPGSPVQLADFFIQPPGATQNGSGPGTIQGSVFDDLNQNGTQDLGELGVPNFTVFIDANQNGALDNGEVSTTSGANGGFFFNNVQPGVYRIDVVIPNEGTSQAAWQINSPAVGYRDVQVVAGGSVTGANFALNNLADSDWGDLPDSYNTLSTNNGASNTVVPGFQLGNLINGEVNGQPTPLATADNSDDGIQIISNGGVLKTGVNTIRVTVFGVGGLLTGWMDFNNDGHFDESERLLWTGGNAQKFNTNASEADLNPGTYDMQVTIPATAVINRPIAARFRWGQQGLTFTGHGEIGETEDYVFGLNYIFGDYNHSGTVDLADYVIWRNSNGQSVTPFSGADGNGDGVVNNLDYEIWRNHLGQSVPGPGAGAILAETSTSSSSNSGSTSVGSGLSYSYSGDGLSSASSAPQYSVLSGGHSANIQVTDTSSTATLSGATSSSGAGTTVASSSSIASSPEFAMFVGESQVGSSSTDTTVVQSRTVSSESSSSKLLLLDQAWADLDSNSFTSFDHGDESLYSDGASHESLNDLALAAVMSEDEGSWNSI